MNIIKRKQIKFVSMLIFIAVLTFSSTLAIVTYAVDHTPHYKLTFGVSMGNERSSVKYWYSQEGSNYYGYRILLGANAWNNVSSIDANISEVSNKSDSNIRVYSKDYGNTEWIGYHTPWIGYGDIKLNEYYQASNGGIERYAEVFAHEMGHAFGLNHYSCSSELMVSSGYINTPNPQTGDISGYKDKYGLK